MKKHRSCLLVFLLLATAVTYGQAQTPPRINQFVDLAGTIGAAQGAIAGAYVHNWRIGKKRKWEAGLGLRATSYFGTKKDFTTAPAKLSRTNTIPFLIVFAGQKTENWDTLTVQRPLVTSVNLSANFGYNFSQRFAAGFNIDLVGFSFGRKSSAILTSNAITRTEPETKVQAFNVLLTGDLDIGTLNSEFFLKYKLSDHWAVRAIYQFYFAEYKTTTIKQTAPDGTMVDRFRNKVNSLGAGVSYHF